MRIKVRLELSFSKYRLNNEKEILIELPEGSKAKEVLLYFGVPETEPMVIIKNGKVVNLDDPLRPEDALIIFPPLEGG
ncbi:MAG: MoaD/ThiS family protein [Bacillota bacterium]